MLGRSFHQKSQSYRNLAQMLEAGVALDQAFNTLIPKNAGGPFGLGSRDADRKRVQVILLGLHRGYSLARAMHQFPKLDVAMINVGEKTGNVPRTLIFLAEYYEDQHRLRASLQHAMIQPGILFLCSIFLREFPALFTHQITFAVYLLHVLEPLSAIALVVAAVFAILRQSTESHSVAEKIWAVAKFIPWLGGRLKSAQDEKLFLCLDLCFRAGVDLGAAMDIASSMLVSPELKRALAQTKARQGKLGFAKALEATGQFRSSHVSAISAGELAGGLDVAFGRIAAELRAERTVALANFSAFAPKVLYIIAAIYVASGIIKSLPKLPEITD